MTSINDPLVPINPHPRKAKKSLAAEFWEDFLMIFITADSFIGILLSIVLAIAFLFRWLFFLVGKYLIRLDIKKPSVRK